MAKIKTIQTNFSAGELSPQGRGRVDIARYNNALKSMQNLISLSLGGVRKRPGLERLASVKTGSPRLIPYIINQDEAFMLEIGDGYGRVYLPDGTQVGAPYEFIHPYTAAQFGSLDYSQGESEMLMFHQSVFPQRLRHFAEDAWLCEPIPFISTPIDEVGDYPAIGLTLSASTVGTGRTVTASAAFFLQGDVGRAILYDTGVAVITAWTDSTHVTAEIKTAFPSTLVPSGEWNLESSPQVNCNPSEPTVAPPEMDPVGTTISFVLSSPGFRSTDVGKYISINSGLVKLTVFTDSTHMNGTIIQPLSATIDAVALSWKLMANVWSAATGYPRTGTFHEQRLVTAGSTLKPQTIWGSKSGDYQDFTLGPNDDDSFSFTLAGNDNQVNLVNFLVSARDLVALSFGGEYLLRGGVEKPITPTNVSIKIESSYGSQQVRPALVGKETLFVQRGGRKLRALSYSFQDDGYSANDLTTLAEHISQTGIKEMAFQQVPEPLLWIVLNNGNLISCTLDKSLDIIAWNPHFTDGAFESVAVLPNGDREQVWFIVRRSVNGSTVRYVERFQPDWFPVYGQTSGDMDAIPPESETFSWGFTLDCAKSYSYSTATDTLTGLDWLEGRTIQIIGDGAKLTEKIVSGGTVTLDRPANQILIGLMFYPLAELLPPEISGQNGTIHGDAMSVHSCVIKLFNTIGCTVNGQETIPGRTHGGSMFDAPPALFTGDAAVSVLGWGKGDAPILISQNDPFPFHMLSVVRGMSINEG